MKPKSLILTASFILLFGAKTFSQCADSSDATLKETTDWIASKINSYGGRNLPPTTYTVKFDSSLMVVYEFGMDANLELKDSVAMVKINLRNIDLSKLAIRYINKSNTRFALSFEGKDHKMFYKSYTLGILDLGYEIIIDCEKEKDLPQRLIKAIKHGYCLSGGTTATVKEKF